MAHVLVIKEIGDSHVVFLAEATWMRDDPS
jgi:hypothetical protein